MELKRSSVEYIASSEYMVSSYNCHHCTVHNAYLQVSAAIGVSLSMEIVHTIFIYVLIVRCVGGAAFVIQNRF